VKYSVERTKTVWR